VTWQTARELRFKRWLSPPGLAFVSEKARATYQDRVRRIIRAISLDFTPDRVPIFPNYTFLPAYVMGSSAREVMNDQDRALEIWGQFGDEFAFDSVNFYGISCPIPLMKSLQYRLYQWPGSPGLPPDHSYRYVDKDWLRSPEEYGAMAEDPSDYWLRRYIPRVCGALSGLSQIDRLTTFSELPSLAGFLASFGRKDVRQSLINLMKSGQLALEWVTKADAFISGCAAKGQPSFAGSFAKAPFDLMTDTFRNKKSSLLDITRHPEILVEAMEALTKPSIHQALEDIDRTGNPLVFMPLHTGDDTFMSPEQFEKFYWQPLKKVLTGLIEAGGVPLLFAEGSYKNRLDYFLDLPKASVCWMMDRVDLASAKKKVGHHCCLAGNVPAYMFLSDDAEAMKRYCRQLIEDVAPGGGFMLSSGHSLDKAQRSMVETMIETTLSYGLY
jgi:hypothetical protein